MRWGKRDTVSLNFMTSPLARIDSDAVVILSTHWAPQPIVPNELAIDRAFDQLKAGK